MSSLRPAKFVATLFQWLGGSLFWPETADGPTCSCHACTQAWRRNQSPKSRQAPVTYLALGGRRMGPGLRH